MHRRKFLRSAGMGGSAAVAVGTFAAPSIAQTMPELKWRLASSFPKSLDTLYGAGEMLVKYVAEMTDNKFQIRIFAAGEIVPGLQVLDAVQNGTVEMGHTAGTYYVGKDPTFAFDTAIPFGTNSRQQDAWMNWGGGRELLAEFYKAYNVHGIVCGATGAQGDIYPALEKGTIDAAEWVGPYDDQKLGFNKITQYYYYPGWWEGGPQPSAYINLEKWNELPKPYKAVMEAGCAQAQKWMLSKYDAENPKALRELASSGTKLMPFTQPVMEACFNASNEIWAEISAKNARFKKVYESWRPFRNEEILWFRVCVQEGLRFVAALPQRRDPVVPRLREHLRQLHGAPVGSRQALSRASIWSVKAPLWRGFYRDSGWPALFKANSACQSPALKGESTRVPT